MAFKLLGKRKTQDLAKSTKEAFQANTDGMNAERSNVPAVVVDRYEKGKFIESQIATVKQVLDNPEKFDNRTLSILIRNVSKKLDYVYDYNETIKICEAIEYLSEELCERMEDGKKEAEKRKGASMDTLHEIAQPNNWQLKNEYFLGKSMASVKIEDIEDGEPLEKSHISQYTKTTKSGNVVTVKEQDDKRTSKKEEAEKEEKKHKEQFLSAIYQHGYRMGESDGEQAKHYGNMYWAGEPHDSFLKGVEDGIATKDSKHEASETVEQEKTEKPEKE